MIIFPPLWTKWRAQIVVNSESHPIPRVKACITQCIQSNSICEAFKGKQLTSCMTHNSIIYFPSQIRAAKIVTESNMWQWFLLLHLQGSNLWQFAHMDGGFAGNMDVRCSAWDVCHIQATWLNPTVCNQNTHRRTSGPFQREPSSIRLNQTCKALALAAYAKLT